MKKSIWEGGEGQIHLFAWWWGRGRINSSSMFLLERGGGGETGIFLSRTVVAIVSHTDTNFCYKDRKTKSE